MPIRPRRRQFQSFLAIVPAFSFFFKAGESSLLALARYMQGTSVISQHGNHSSISYVRRFNYPSAHFSLHLETSKYLPGQGRGVCSLPFDLWLLALLLATVSSQSPAAMTSIPGTEPISASPTQNSDAAPAAAGCGAFPSCRSSLVWLHWLNLLCL